jgi:RHS repeat-associated protein
LLRVISKALDKLAVIPSCKIEMLSGNRTGRYFNGPGVDFVLAEEKGDGAILWALADNQGSVRDLVNESGAIVSHISYDSFGRVLIRTGNVDFRYGYTGRERDEETGLEYYRACYYDAAVGRFISEDPIGFGAGDNGLNKLI